MKIKRKYSPRKPKEEKPVVEVSSAEVTPNAPPAETFTANDLNTAAQDDKPKRKYTRRNAGNETAGLQFGELTVFAGELAAKLSSVITKQDAPLNPTEKQMLKTVGDTCGRFLLDGVDVEQVAPKYAKVAVVGMLGLVVGVRALDYFMRPRLTAGQPANISYDTAPDIEAVPDIQG